MEIKGTTEATLAEVSKLVKIAFSTEKPVARSFRAAATRSKFFNILTKYLETNKVDIVTTESKSFGKTYTFTSRSLKGRVEVSEVTRPGEGYWLVLRTLD